jgi:hypothetical protein
VSADATQGARAEQPGRRAVVPPHVLRTQVVVRDSEGNPIPVRDQNDKPTGEYKLADTACAAPGPCSSSRATPSSIWTI